MRNIIVYLLGAAILVACVSASADDVVVLTDKNFADTLANNEFVFVEFYVSRPSILPFRYFDS